MTLVYPGSELDLFAAAANWKRYVAGIVRPLVGARVLEVGGGIGGNIARLHRPTVTEWVSVEPDPRLASRIERRIASGELPATCRVVTGTVEAVADRRFDTILYLDVLEHIADDREELRRAAARLGPGGRLVVLAPACQFLYSPFDAAIGHHRRYSRAALRALAPPACRLTMLRALDSAGLLAALGNRLILRSSTPTRAQIALWDRVLVPLSRAIDGFTGYRFGKSLLSTWTKQA